MLRDNRGGHNRKNIDEDFFKTWSPKMSYVLGLILADGAVEDVQKSSRTCYLQFTSIDKSLLEQIKTCLSSSHKLIFSGPRSGLIRGKPFKSEGTFNLRIGNKIIYRDLFELGVAPKKADRINLPSVPDNYFNFLVRGYFDGDGCVNIYKPKNRDRYRLQVIFTSCCKDFLSNLAQKIEKITKIGLSEPYFNYYAYRIMYKDTRAIKLLSYMYGDLDEAPFLDRKYQIYQHYLSLC